MIRIGATVAHVILTQSTSKTVAVIDANTGAYDCHPDSQNPKSVATAKDYANTI